MLSSLPKKRGEIRLHENGSSALLVLSNRYSWREISSEAHRAAFLPLEVPFDRKISSKGFLQAFLAVQMNC